MDSTTQLIKISSFNCHSVKKSIIDVQNLTKVSSLVALQETWLLPHDLDFIQNINSEFSGIAKSSVDTSLGILKGRPYGGLAILWKKSMFPHVVPIDCSSDRIMAVQVNTTDLAFLVINVYMPVDNPLNMVEFVDLLGAINAVVEESEVQCVYIVGDFNAHPGASFGVQLKSFCSEVLWEWVDMNMLEKKTETYTYKSDINGALRWLDHCLSTKAAWNRVVSVDILHDVMWSDHYPLIVAVEIPTIRNRVSGWITSGRTDSLAKVKWGQRDSDQIHKYGKYCFDNLNNFNLLNDCDNNSNRSNLCDCDNLCICTNSKDFTNFIDEYYNHIISVLQTAAVVSSGVCKPSRQKEVIGWNYHVRDSHQRARLHFGCWIAAGKPSSGNLYDNMRNSRIEFKNKIRWCQKNEESIKMNLLALNKQNKNFSKFWNLTKTINNKRKQNLPIAVDGVQDPTAIAELFAQKFKLKPLPSNSNLMNTNNSQTPASEVFPKFSRADVAREIKSMKKGKSPGFDGLSMEHLLWGSYRLHEHLGNLFNLCIKYSYLPVMLMKTIVVPIAKNKTGDLMSSSNYRPISLGTVIGKVLERLLRPSLLRDITISDAQFGFRAGASTDTAIYCLKNTVHYYTSRNTSVYALFLDLSRAFDLVNYEILWAKLQSNVPCKIVDLLRYWYRHQTNFVRWGDSTSSSYSLECGVRQGALTSPDLFNCYVNDLIEKLRSTGVGCHVGNVCVNNLSYADDMVLLSPSIKGLRRLVSVCEQYAIDHGLKYNVSKTEMLVFRAGGGPDQVPSVYLNGAEVAVVKRFKYLGHWMTENLKDDVDIDRERRALSVRSNMLARRFARCSREVKDILFKTFCLGMYTCQLWANYTKKSFNTIRIQYNNAYRALMRYPRYCSASTMFANARIPDFFAVVRSRAASFWVRVNSSENDIVRAVSNNFESQINKHWNTVHMKSNCNFR